MAAAAVAAIIASLRRASHRPAVASPHLLRHDELISTEYRFKKTCISSICHVYRMMTLSPLVTLQDNTESWHRTFTKLTGGLGWSASEARCEGVPLFVFNRDSVSFQVELVKAANLCELRSSPHIHDTHAASAGNKANQKTTALYIVELQAPLTFFLLCPPARGVMVCNKFTQSLPHSSTIHLQPLALLDATQSCRRRRGDWQAGASF